MDTDEASPVRVKSSMHSSTTLTIDEESDQELSRPQLLALTCTLGGLQVVWSILNGNINIFLLSIGIPASISPLIWVIAPFCGTVVQPLVGWLSDRSESKYGRRKPFILFGTLSTITALIGLSWSQNIARNIGSAATQYIATRTITIVWVILLNVSIQPLQMGIRALVIDSCSKAQQPQANAWASCAASIGNVFGYLVSFTTASMSVHVFGFSHFKELAVIASLCLGATVIINLVSFHERDHQAVQHSDTKLTFLTLFHHFRHSRLVSSRTRIINRIQFCAWLGWFPFLFYMTTFVTSLESEPRRVESTNSKTHPGALAGFLYALVSCIGSLLIPQLLHKTKYADAEIRASSSAPIATLLGTSLEEVWCIGQLFFGLLMALTILAFNPAGGVVIIAFAGIPWALANYIPFALIGVEVAEQRSLQHSSIVVVAGDDEGEDDSNYRDDDEEDEEETNQEVEFGTGATIGLHNAAISAPQILAALISAAVLGLSERFGVQDGVGWVIRLSGVAALIAAWQIRRLITK